ncbi:MAG TPA: NUMOD1 domain-containing DNA-binding protein [Chitinophagaceae bacterium]|nr:NUMOD1 domain-containing DNA-binding protein [Chitinophagaceae bacterium]
MKKYPYQNTGLKSLKGERWKNIPGFEMYFMVSNFGRIKRLEYELEYSDGRVYLKPARIIKPVLVKIPNVFMKDHIYFLRTSITLYKQKYHFSIARLVYHCFKSPIKLKDESIVILTKDRNGQNIRVSNLVKASLSQKQKRISDLNRRTPLVVDKEARIRGIAQAKLTNNKRVTQYNLQGKKVKTHPSIAVAAEKIGISHSLISNRARGTEFSAGGFIWRFGDESVIDILPMLKTIAERRKKNKAIFGKKVTQYKMNGRRVAIFPTITDAARETGIKRAEISRVIQKNRYSTGGFFWQEGEGPALIDLSGHEYGEVVRAKNRQRPVQQYSIQGKPLQQFDSIKKAAEVVGVKSTTIIGALTGKQQSAGGYQWKYL